MNNPNGGYQQRGWMDTWLTPTSLLVLLGGVTWGVQLNLAVGHLTEDVAAMEAEDRARDTRVDLTEDVAAMEAEDRARDTRVEELSDQLLRVSLILERIEKRLTKVGELE